MDGHTTRVRAAVGWVGGEEAAGELDAGIRAEKEEKKLEKER